MSGLTAAINSAAQNLRVINLQIDTVQNNVSNANTPGYVKQRLQVVAQSFNPEKGSPGGINSAGLISSRNKVDEQKVRQQQSAAGFAQNTTSQLQGIETLFPVRADQGLQGAVSNLFNSFQQLSVKPNDGTTRQTVLDQAGQVARQFQSVGSGLQVAKQNANSSISETVANINGLAKQIQQLNIARQQADTSTPDPSSDAALYSTIEELSKYIDVNAIQQPDGTFTVLAGNQTTLVIGGQLKQLGVSNSNTQADITDDTGKVVTGGITSGSLASQLAFRNTTLPQYQQSIDTLAQTLADKVNQTLSAGLDQTGAAPANALFQYTAGAAATTLAVNPAITTSGIAAALPGAPGGNGNALALAGLANQNLVAGQTFTGYIGSVSSKLGRDVNSAQQASDTQATILTQVKSTRDARSGVSLDEEAANLVQLQSAYQATAKLFSVLDQLTQVTLGLVGK